MPLEEIDVSILRYRKDNRISQEDFAALVGVQQATVSNWESCKVRPAGENLVKILELMNDKTPELSNRTVVTELSLLRELLSAKEEIIMLLKERVNKNIRKE